MLNCLLANLGYSSEKRSIFCRFQLVDQIGLTYDDFVFPECMSLETEKEIQIYMEKLALYRRTEYSFFERFIDVHPICNEVIGENAERKCHDKSLFYVSLVQRTRALYFQDEDVEFAELNKDKTKSGAHLNVPQYLGIQEFFKSLRPNFGIPSLNHQTIYFERMNKIKFIQHYQLNASIYFDKASSDR